MDSEATKHMNLHRAGFDIYEVIALRKISLNDNNIIEAVGMRTIVVKAIMKDKVNGIYIKNVHHMPKLHANLLSVNKLVSNGLKMQFNLNESLVKVWDSEAFANCIT